MKIIFGCVYPKEEPVHGGKGKPDSVAVWTTTTPEQRHADIENQNSSNAASELRIRDRETTTSYKSKR